GWSSSAGTSAIRTDKNAIQEAIRSVAECAASLKMLTEPETMPTTSFRSVRRLFDRIESCAAAIFCRRVCWYEVMSGIRCHDVSTSDGVWTAHLVRSADRPIVAQGCGPRNREL